MEPSYAKNIFVAFDNDGNPGHMTELLNKNKDAIDCKRSKVNDYSS